jgi:hypothetical protein
VSARIVIIGPVEQRGDERVIHAAEITPLDGEAFLANPQGAWRVTLSRLSGPLSDATVIMSTREGGVTDLQWRACMLVCPDAQEFEMVAPMPVAA